jgi:hypothetical protein
MTRLDHIPGPAPWWCGVGLAVVLMAVMAIRVHPFVDDVPWSTARGDDWLAYKRQALSIVHDGLTMPIVAGPSSRPAGFLYNYFVAGVFATFGENSSAVYVVQAGLLGLTVGGMVAAFGPGLSPVAGWGYLGALSAFLVIDVFRHYTARLLSENLLLALLPLFFGAARRMLEDGRLTATLLAGTMLGLAVLARPGVLPVAFGLAGLCLGYPAGRPGRLARATVLLAAVSLVVGLMALRNYAVTGAPSLRAITDTRDWVSPLAGREEGSGLAAVVQGAWQLATHYGARLAFCLGFTPVLNPAYRIRPHWIVMWALVGVFVVVATRRRRWIPADVLAAMFVVLYLGPVVAAAQIANYGFRMVVSATPAALYLAVRALDLTARRGVGLTVDGVFLRGSM